jgi:hypothetical protein
VELAFFRLEKTKAKSVPTFRKGFYRLSARVLPSHSMHHQRQIALLWCMKGERGHRNGAKVQRLRLFAP